MRVSWIKESGFFNLKEIRKGKMSMEGDMRWKEAWCCCLIVVKKA
jgi:hypothetical protein